MSMTYDRNGRSDCRSLWYCTLSLLPDLFDVFSFTTAVGQTESMIHTPGEKDNNEDLIVYIYLFGIK